MVNPETDQIWYKLQLVISVYLYTIGPDHQLSLQEPLLRFIDFWIEEIWDRGQKLFTTHTNRWYTSYKQNTFMSMATISMAPTPLLSTALIKSWKSLNCVPGPQIPSRDIYAMLRGSEAPVALQ